MVCSGCVTQEPILMPSFLSRRAVHVPCSRPLLRLAVPSEAARHEKAHADPRFSGTASISVTWRTRVSGVPCVALVLIAGRSGVLRIALVSIGGGAGVTRTTRIARVPIARRWVPGISIGWITVTGVRVTWIPVYRITVIGPGRWWGRRSYSPKYPGCAANRGPECGSRPAARRCSNSSARSGSQYAPAEAALDWIIRVCASRKA